ncbi:MAG: 50S ribosomal protein L9 [Planctomycetota bacterium]
MSKNVELLLTENVDHLGIVGDVVKVRLGFARNYLLPRELATTPSQEKIDALASKRAEAERELAEKRALREKMVSDLEDFELTLVRSCNDQGLLYGSVSQKDIADALGEKGFEVRERDVRIAHTIKRVDSYEVLIKPESDLEATIKLWVQPDRELDTDEETGVEVDDEGNPIDPEAVKLADEVASEKKGVETDADGNPVTGD